MSDTTLQDEREKATLEKIKAETRRAEAETTAALAEAKEFEANAAKALAEAEEKRANAAKALADAKLLEIDFQVRQYEVTQEKIRTEENEREWLEKKADNKYHHVYNFTKAVESESVQDCMKQLAYWMRTEPKCDIEIVFSSPGGSVIDGMALFDYIQQVRRAGHKITTGSIGYAASMAGILLQAGDIRWMGKEAYILVHEVSSFAGGKPGDIEDELKFVKKIQERVLTIFEERCQQAGKNGTAKKPLTKAQLKDKWSRKDWWIESSEAIEWGLVDEVR